eukprot:3887185-Pleurochrysis_carterae.AAC.3
MLGTYNTSLVRWGLYSSAIRTWTLVSGSKVHLAACIAGTAYGGCSSPHAGMSQSMSMNGKARQYMHGCEQYSTQSVGRYSKAMNLCVLLTPHAFT